MAEKITREDGTEIEVFTAEELEKAKAEAEVKVRSEESGKLEQLETEKSGLVEELKILRKKKEPQPNPSDNKGNGNENVEEVVEKLLEAKELERAKKNEELALELFKQNNKEFHPDNDPGSLKFKKLKVEYDLYRKDGLKEVSDFNRFLEKAKNIVLPEDTKVDNINIDTTVPNNRSPKGKGDSKVTSEEASFIKKAGWTEERYLKLKEAQPEYVARLLKQAELAG